MEPLSLDQSAFMVTVSGVHFNLIKPRPEDVRIEDIAHALSNLCRFTGHTSRFYSVATHSLLAAKYVDPEFALEALMHDAAEAYINDLSRPLKHHPECAGYRHIERLVEFAIREHFHLPWVLSHEVKAIDDMLVVDEAIALMADHDWTLGHDHLNIDIPDYSPKESKERFLQRFAELTQ